MSQAFLFYAVWTGVFPAESSLPLPGATLNNHQHPGATAPGCFYSSLFAQASLAHNQP
jgi:hypothetical protein